MSSASEPVSAPPDVERYRALLEERFGLVIAPWQVDRLAGFVRDHTADAGDPSPEALRAAAAQITVSETYFFREEAQLEALVELALPDRMRVRGPDRPARVLSVGCASGEEAYSLAMLLEDRRPALPPGEVTIQGIDLSHAMVARARAGRYSPWALRSAPPHAEERWFRREGGEVCLAEAIRARASFEAKNLFDDDPELWAPGSLDVVLCRNVTIYFSERATRAAIARFANALGPGGYLFLGHSESLHRISDEFDRVHTHGAFYYRRKGVPAVAADPHATTPPPPPSLRQPKGGGTLPPPSLRQPKSDRPPPSTRAPRRLR